MKRIFASLVVLSSLSAFAQDSDLSKKINDINAEIKKIQGYKAEGVASPIFDEQLRLLEDEKSKYLRLQSQEKRKAERVKKQAVQENKAEIVDKKFPTALKKDLANMRQYNDESIPIEKRYELVLQELGNLYDITEKLQELPEDQRSESVRSLITENKDKLQELESIKTRYELKIRELEQNELADMKKHGLRLGGMFDFYYQWDFNNPKRTGNNGAEIPYRNYTNRHNDFTVNLVELNVYKSFKNLDFYADIDFGESAEQNESEGADGVTHHIGQAFLRYKLPAMNNFTFTAGKFYTHFGLEVTKNIENRTYSRPFYFTLVCPFWHEGISLTQSGLFGGFGYGLYVYDKSDDRVDNDSDKTYGFQLNYAGEKFSAVYNLISGSEQNDLGGQTDLNHDGSKKTQSEIIVTHNTTDYMTLVFDGVVGTHQNFDSTTGKDAHWLALVGYADFKIAHNDSINFRYENFKDMTSDASAVNLFGNSVTAPTVDSYTITNRYQIPNGTEIRLEYRYDVATKEIFPDSDGGFKKSQSTLALGWLYSI